MARYIDADELLKELQEELDFETPMYTEEQNKYFNSGLRCAIRDVKKAPTADVVPKSEVEALTIELESERGSLNAYKTKHRNAKVEVENLNLEIERLQHILDSYALQYGTVMDKHIVVEKAREDVAREIFEEIDGITDLVAKGLIGELEFYDKIAELKKKYTESENASGEQR